MYATHKDKHIHIDEHAQKGLKDASKLPPAHKLQKTAAFSARGVIELTLAN
jgi:hypothetical protein